MFGITNKTSVKDLQSVAVYCLCLSWCGEQVHLSVQSQPWISFLLDHCSSGIFRCKDAIKKELACLPLFKAFPLFSPPSSLSLLLSVPIKGQWISLPYFQVTSSVFDFYAYLKLAMGLTLSPLISPARNWTCLSCLSDDGPLMGGIHLAGACLDVGLDGCRTQREERTRAL